MKLGIFLAMGDSLTSMAKSGQDPLFIKSYLSRFSKNFDKVYVFSYQNEPVKNLPANVIIVKNKYRFHRYIYGLGLPFLNSRILKDCDVARAYHLSGTVPAILAKILYKIPFAFNFAFDYEKFSKIEKKILQYYFFKLIKPIALKFSDIVLVANKTLFTQINKKKAIYHPNGVDISKFIFVDHFKDRGDRHTILCVGRLVTQKNFESVIYASKGLNVKILIIGHGQLKKHLAFAAKKSNVELKIIDRISNEKINTFYKKSNIFVLPSLIEGNPKVLLEAMATGMPVLGTKVEGIKEIITNGVNGLSCGTDSNSISQALKKLIKNKSLSKKLGINAREYILKNHNLDNLLANEIKLLKSLHR